MTTGDHRFHRWINPAGRSASVAPHEIEATQGERDSLAAWLGIPAVHSLTASFRLNRESADSVSAEGSFSVFVDLVCGVTLDTFTDTLHGTISALFRKDTARDPVTAGDVDVDLDTEEPRDWPAQGIDLGALLAEELSLALPDFPRKPGVELAEAPPEDDTEPAPNPFDILRSLTRAND